MQDRTVPIGPPGVPRTRRAISRGVLASGLVGAWMATGLLDVHAQATPVGAEGRDDEARPVRYLLEGEEVVIAFMPAAGTPALLEYRDSARSLSFAGDEVDLTSASALGQMASVLLEAVPDAYARYLTLLVPEVNQDENQLEVPVRTLAILTDHLTSIAGPRLVEGALQRYEVVALEGVARFTPD